MKIAIDKSLLIAELDKLSIASPVGKTPLAILEGILVEAQSNQVHFTRNNLDVAIMRTINCEVLDPGKTVVNSKMFTDIIKRMPDEEIDIITDDQKMVIEAGQTHMEIGALSATDYPPLPEIDSDTGFEIDQQVLKRLVSGVSYAVAIDDKKPSLTGIYIDVQNGILNVVAIDGYSMAWRKAKTDLSNIHILPKGNDFDNVCKLLDEGKAKITASKSNIGIESEGMKITLRSLDGEYLNYAGIVPKTFITTARIKVKEFLQAVERSLLFRQEIGGKLNGTMTIKISQKGFNLTLHNFNGKFDEDFPADVEGDNLSISFDPLKIYNSLRHVEDKEVIIKFSSNVGPCIISPVNSDLFTYFILPVVRS